MAVLPLIRLVVLGVTTLFSIIVLGITANLIALTEQYYNTTATFSALAIAVAAISLATLPVMLVVDFLRHGAFTSMIVVELGWLFILCVLWVAAAGETVSQFNFAFPVGCDFRNTILNGACQQIQAVQAFSFLNFIILLVYTIALCVIAGIAASRGQGVWLSSVKESFGSSAGPAQHPMTQYNTSAPPQQVMHTPVQPQYTGGAPQYGAPQYAAQYGGHTQPGTPAMTA